MGRFCAQDFRMQHAFEDQVIGKDSSACDLLQRIWPRNWLADHFVYGINQWRRWCLDGLPVAY